VTRPAASLALIFAVVLAIRLPFLNHPIQGDDLYYLYGAEHAQIEPLQPKHTTFVFRGDAVDMRGHSHGPLNAWVLGALLAVWGDVREVPFHIAYTAFSLVAAWAMWSLARRFSERPLLATLLFLAVPAFVVNGNSFEADLPFLACWMSAIALFVRAVGKDSLWNLAGAALAVELAAGAAYQAVFLTPILGGYLWLHRRTWLPGWVVVLAAPAAIASLQFWERSEGGALPAAVLVGYMQQYGFQAIAQKARSGVALAVHTGWLVSPLLAVAMIQGRWRVALASAAALGAALYDSNPLFWVSVGLGVAVLSAALAQRDFLGWWVAVFFVGALVVFFAGSARYLLPMAAPVAIMAARLRRPLLPWAGFATNVALALALAGANYQHWEGYRRFAASLAGEAASRRVWVNGEWGLRYYLEAEGALPLSKTQPLAPGEIVVTSELAAAVTVNDPLAPLSQAEIAPSIPLRLISLRGGSAYSSSARGLLPFEVSSGPADRLRAQVVLERRAELSYLDPRDPKSRQQILSGLFPDGWMGSQAAVLLKAPEKPTALRIEVFIPPGAPARRVRLLVGEDVAAEEVFPKPGAYALAAPFSTAAAALTVHVDVDKTHRVPGDERDLGLVVTGIGFR
jgi:hypothetical protein